MAKLKYDSKASMTAFQAKPEVQVAKGLTTQYYQERMAEAVARRMKRLNDPKEERRKAIAEDLRAGMTKTAIRAKHRCSHDFLEDILADLRMGKYGGITGYVN